MRREFTLLVILSGFFSLQAQETEIQYLSGLDKDHTVQIQTKELPITILQTTEDLFLHLFTPATATNLREVRGGMIPPFPSGNISVLHGISPVGTKFLSAQAESPQGEKNSFNGEFLSGMIYFRFGE